MRQTIAVLFALVLLAINSAEQRTQAPARLPVVVPDFTGKTAPAHIVYLEDRKGPTLCAEVHAGCGEVEPTQNLAFLQGWNPAR